MRIGSRLGGRPRSLPLERGLLYAAGACVYPPVGEWPQGRAVLGRVRHMKVFARYPFDLPPTFLSCHCPPPAELIQTRLKAPATVAYGVDGARSPTSCRSLF